VLPRWAQHALFHLLKTSILFGNLIASDHQGASIRKLSSFAVNFPDKPGNQ
jgi:hypothetical protein